MSSKTSRILYEHTWTVLSASFLCSLADRLKNTSLSVFVGPQRVCLHPDLLQVFGEKLPAAFLRGREEQSKETKASSQLTEYPSGHQLVTMPMQCWLGFNCQSLKDSFVVVRKPQDRSLSLPLHAAVAEVDEGADSSCFESLYQIPENINRRDVERLFLNTSPVASDPTAVRIICLEPC